MKGIYFRILGWLAVFALAGCSKPVATQTANQGTETAIQIASSAFSEGSSIPKKYTCDGDDISPDLSWSGVPTGTQSLALVADDPDAPGGTFVHWVLYDIPGTRSGFAEAVEKTGSSADIGIQGTNSAGKPGYMGPCPPKGSPHRYFFKLYALDSALNLKPGASKADVEEAMQGHILAQGQVMGKYGR